MLILPLNILKVIKKISSKSLRQEALSSNFLWYGYIDNDEECFQENEGSSFFRILEFILKQTPLKHGVIVEASLVASSYAEESPNYHIDFLNVQNEMLYNIIPLKMKKSHKNFLYFKVNEHEVYDAIFMSDTILCFSMLNTKKSFSWNESLQFKIDLEFVQKVKSFYYFGFFFSRLVFENIDT